MRTSKIIAVILLILVIVLWSFTIYVNVDNIVGAFGDGPPYYGRTTNMDKWANPLPYLVGFDLVIAIISYFVLKWIFSIYKK